jgi:hypothetical protein
MLRAYVFYGLAALLGACALWYLMTFRKWTAILKDPDFQKLNEKQREASMATPQYAKLRGAVRIPIALSLLLFAALYLVMRTPF